MHLKGDVFAAPMPWAGHLPVTRFLQALYNLVWNSFRVRTFTASLGQPVPMSHDPHSKEFLQNTERKLTPFQSAPITPCLISTVPEEESFSHFPVGIVVLGFVVLPPCS